MRAIALLRLEKPDQPVLEYMIGSKHLHAGDAGGEDIPFVCRGCLSNRKRRAPKNSPADVTWLMEKASMRSSAELRL